MNMDFRGVFKNNKNIKEKSNTFIINIGKYILNFVYFKLKKKNISIQKCKKC